MNRSQLLQQLILLRAAVGNVLDNNPNVCHITMGEIHQWIDDIVGWMKE
tara:strand:- start:361 stop:507 length:147 start_codon:yes stop_codon:yes gene_type:complete